MAGLKRKREEKNESSEEEEVTAWTIDDLKLNDRQEAILKMKGNNQLKHICKWARRSEEFRDNSETPEYCGNGVIGDYAASDFIKSLYDTGKYAPTDSSFICENLLSNAVRSPRREKCVQWSASIYQSSKL